MKITREQQAALNRMWKINTNGSRPNMNAGFKTNDKVAYACPYYAVLYPEGFGNVPMSENSFSSLDDCFKFCFSPRNWTDLFPATYDKATNWKQMMSSEWLKGFEIDKAYQVKGRSKYRTYELQTSDNKVHGVWVNPQYLRDILILLKAHKADEDFAGCRVLVDPQNYQRGVFFSVTHNGETSYAVLFPVRSEDTPFTPRKS